MQEKSSVLNEADGPSKEGGRFGLARLIFSVVGILGGYRAFTWVAGLYLLRNFQSSPNSVVGTVLDLAYPTTAIFLLVEMLIVISIYRPWASLFDIPQVKATEILRTREAFVGAGAGLLVFLAAMPFLKDLSTRTLFLTIFPASHPLGPRSVTYVVLLGLALPAAGEIVFRGIVIRTLQSYAGAAAAILVSTLLFVSIWPLFGIAVRLLLGIAASLLYTWRKSLISPIFADIVATVCGGLYVLWRAWS